MMMKFQRMNLILLLLGFLCQFVWVSSEKQLSKTTESKEQVIVQYASDCSSIHTVGGSVSEYQVVMQLARYNCSREKRGFYCGQTFIQKDNFANLGTRLCVDIQGTQDDISGMHQLLVSVSDKEGDLKQVYANTRLRPEDQPYYVCTQPNQNIIKVFVKVRQSVKVCPEILDYLFTHRIRMGNVTSMPLVPTALVDFGRCEIEETPDSESYLIKVDAEGSASECHITKRLPLSYSYMRGCLKVVYFSRDFDCDIMVRLSSQQNVVSDIALQIDRSPGSDMQRCETFAGRNGNPVLSLKVYPYRYSICRGQFALSIDFRQTPPPDKDDDDSDKKSPNLYMAVFITLIAICLVCLGLTCLCCIRFRAKRLRRLQRRNNHRQVSVPNQGFQYDISSVPPYENNISWSPTEPGMLFGLPSYDDVVAESSGGINPSDDSYKNDLPPAYDSVCSTSDS